jgi:hypothetical protein
MSHTLLIKSAREPLLKPMNVVVNYSKGEWKAELPTLQCVSHGTTRDACLQALIPLAQAKTGTESILVVEEDPPALIGVSEVGRLLEWDRRKVAVYAARGNLPPPVAELAGGRVWRRADIEEYAATKRDSEDDSKQVVRLAPQKSKRLLRERTKPRKRLGA